MNERCPQCGAPRSQNDTVCKYCGEKLAPIQTNEAKPTSNTQSPNGQPVVIINNGSAPKQGPQNVQPIRISNTYVIGKKKKPWFLFVIILILVIAGLIIVFAR